MAGICKTWVMELIKKYTTNNKIYGNYDMKIVEDFEKIELCGQKYEINALPWLTNIPLVELQKKVLEKTPDFIPYEEYFIPYIKGNNYCCYKNYRELSECLGNKIKELEISNLGNVKLCGKILTQTFVRDGCHKGFMNGTYDHYLEIIFDENYKGNWLFLVHRLVAEIWCVNIEPNYYEYVHHIINDGKNNRFDNLLWVTEEQHHLIHNN